MQPLVKKGDTISYTIAKIERTAKVFQSNPKAVWIQDGSGRVIKLHKRMHKIKVIKDPKEGKEETPKETLDDLLNGLKDRL